MKFIKVIFVILIIIFRVSLGEKFVVGESVLVIFIWYSVNDKDDMILYLNGFYIVIVCVGGCIVIGSFDIIGNFDLGDWFVLCMKIFKDDGVFLIFYFKEKFLIEVIVMIEEVNI